MNTLPVIVQKYGGSSLADLNRLGLVADQVVATAETGCRVVVVVSAMGKTTDGLLSLAREVHDEPSRRELDMLVSTGERVSMALLSIAIRKRGRDAISFTGSQAGIVTTERHFDARIVEVRPERVMAELDRGQIVIVAGYQGVSASREITTLGRGGSDTTAVALAAALGAHCEIYSDVDGIYTADPRTVAGAQHLKEIDPSLLQVAAEAGAKVLNAQAVAWCKRAGITLYARKTGVPYPRKGVPSVESTTKARQTLVRRSEESAQAWIVAVQRNMVRVQANSLAELGQALADANLVAAELNSNGGGAEAWICLLNAPDWPKSQRSLEAAGLHTLADGFAAVTVVGEGLTTEGPFTPDRLVAMAPEAIQTLSSGLRVCWYVPEAAADVLANRAHLAMTNWKSTDSGAPTS